MCVVAGVAAIGAVGSLGAGMMSADATKSASNAAINEQNKALNQQAQLSAPYRQFGQSAIPMLSNLLGLGPRGQAQALATLHGLPGYNFAQQQGTQGTLNSLSSMGLGLSGNSVQGLSKFNQGLADQNYQQYVGNLQNAVGMGQAAAAGQAANIGSAANNISSNMINQGNTMAGIDANTIAGITKSIGNAGDQYIMGQTLAGLGGGGGGALPSTLNNTGLGGFG